MRRGFGLPAVCVSQATGLSAASQRRLRNRRSDVQQHVSPASAGLQQERVHRGPAQWHLRCVIDSGWVNRWMHECVDGERERDGWVDRWRGSEMDGKLVGWMDGWMDEQIDGRVDGWLTG